jgi:hypothetical protein
MSNILKVTMQNSILALYSGRFDFAEFAASRRNHPAGCLAGKRTHVPPARSGRGE